MRGLKGVIVVASIIATAAALGACRKNVVAPAPLPPMKLGAAAVTIDQAVRV